MPNQPPFGSTSPESQAAELSAITPLLERVLRLAPVHSFKAGEPILAPGAATDAFYYLVTGTVEVSYTDPLCDPYYRCPDRGR